MTALPRRYGAGCAQYNLNNLVFHGTATSGNSPWASPSEAPYGLLSQRRNKARLLQQRILPREHNALQSLDEPKTKQVRSALINALLR